MKVVLNRGICPSSLYMFNWDNLEKTFKFKTVIYSVIPKQWMEELSLLKNSSSSIHLVLPGTALVGIENPLRSPRRICIQIPGLTNGRNKCRECPGLCPKHVVHPESRETPFNGGISLSCRVDKWLTICAYHANQIGRFYTITENNAATHRQRSPQNEKPKNSTTAAVAGWSDEKSNDPYMYTSIYTVYSIVSTYV
ncbi:hypothetical protein CBL_01670 [Carabus blaptoides fortunei]